MTSTFWGHRMLPGDSFPIRYKGVLALNQISLEQNPKEGKTVLKVKAKGNTFVLCSLVKDLVERQDLSHFFFAEDEATLLLSGTNAVSIIGAIEDDDERSDTEEEESEQETITGQPTYANYLSDLLGPDLPDEEDEDFEMDENDTIDDYGTLQFRDPTDNALLGGFELRHFNLVSNVPGFDPVDLREQEESKEETLLNDNIARGLINSLLNSGDEFQIKKGKQYLKKLKRQCRERSLQSQ